MPPSISQILKRSRVDGSFHSHVSLVEPRGTYQINRQDIEEFWDSYCRTIEENPNTVLGVGEKPKNDIPVLVDIDIKADIPETGLIEAVYCEKHVRDVVEIYQSILRDITQGIISILHAFFWRKNHIRFRTKSSRAVFTCIFHIFFSVDRNMKCN